MPMTLCIIVCDPDDGRTSAMDDRFLVVNGDQEVIANCVSREVAEKLVAALSDNGEAVSK